MYLRTMPWTPDWRLRCSSQGHISHTQAILMNIWWGSHSPRGARASWPEIFDGSRDKRRTVHLIHPYCCHHATRHISRMRGWRSCMPSHSCVRDSVKFGPRMRPIQSCPTLHIHHPRRVTGRHREVFWRPWSREDGTCPTACCSVQLHGIQWREVEELDQSLRGLYLWDSAWQYVDTRTLLAEERIAHCETVDSDADETGVVWLRWYIFFRWVRDTMDEMSRGSESLSRALHTSWLAGIEVCQDETV